MKNILNALGKKREPFIFIIDFDLDEYYISSVDDTDSDIIYDIDGFTNISNSQGESELKKTSITSINPISFKKYSELFSEIIEEIKFGNTYLLNLTSESEITLNCSLIDIVKSSRARFRLYYKNKFVVFSPERFIKIENDIIKTYPMKGTIDASIENAEMIILENEKEMAEHVMIVDLLRNDLSIKSRNTEVNRFRFSEKINAGKKSLIQISSEVQSQCGKNWQDRVGDILLSLLPAGSVTGTPKIKTVELINRIENYKRGFYTGVFGYFDGDKLDSSVMIRFIEKREEKYFYKSGGGITILSDAESEYRELMDKIYIPH